MSLSKSSILIGRFCCPFRPVDVCAASVQAFAPIFTGEEVYWHTDSMLRLGPGSTLSQAEHINVQKSHHAV